MILVNIGKLSLASTTKCFSLHSNFKWSYFHHSQHSDCGNVEIMIEAKVIPRLFGLGLPMTKYVLVLCPISTNVTKNVRNIWKIKLNLLNSILISLNTIIKYFPKNASRQVLSNQVISLVAVLHSHLYQTLRFFGRK